MMNTMVIFATMTLVAGNPLWACDDATAAGEFSTDTLGASVKLLTRDIFTTMENGSWVTSPVAVSDGDLETKLKSTGYYKPFGIPFKSFNDVRQTLQNKSILIIGDSYQQNLFIELVDLYLGITANTSTSNPPNGVQTPNSTCRNDFVLRATKLIRNATLLKVVNPEYNQNAITPPISYLGSDIRSDVHGVGSCLFANLDTLFDPLLIDKIQIEVGHFGVGTAQAFQLWTTLPCIREYLATFDVLVIGLQVHDMSRASAFYRPRSTRHRRYIQAVAGIYKNLAGLVPRTIWVGAKSYANTATPQKYVSVQNGIGGNIEAAFRLCAMQHDTDWVDHHIITATCAWENCTVEDHHHSRMVNRVKALRVLQMISQKTHPVQAPI